MSSVISCPASCITLMQTLAVSAECLCFHLASYKNHKYLALGILRSSKTCVFFSRRRPTQQRRAELRDARSGQEGPGQPQVPDGSLEGAVHAGFGRYSPGMSDGVFPFCLRLCVKAEAGGRALGQLALGCATDPRLLAALEQQCDEHRKRAKELKHKSQHLNNVLMTLTPVSVPAPLKRPRLTRATSGPAAITSQVLSQPAQIAVTPTVSQLSSLPLGKVVSTLTPSVLGKSPSQPPAASSPASPLLGGYTVLASSGTSFPGAVEIHPDAPNLTVLSTAAAQDGSTVVKVVSPFQLLTLPGLGTAIQNVTHVAAAGGSAVLTVPPEGPVAEHAAATIEVTALADEAEQK